MNETGTTVKNEAEALAEVPPLQPAAHENAVQLPSRSEIIAPIIAAAPPALPPYCSDISNESDDLVFMNDLQYSSVNSAALNQELSRSSSPPPRSTFSHMADRSYIERITKTKRKIAHRVAESMTTEERQKNMLFRLDMHSRHISWGRTNIIIPVSSIGLDHKRIHLNPYWCQTRGSKTYRRRFPPKKAMPLEYCFCNKEDCAKCYKEVRAAEEDPGDRMVTVYKSSTKLVRKARNDAPTAAMSNAPAQDMPSCSSSPIINRQPLINDHRNAAAEDGRIPVNTNLTVTSSPMKTPTKTIPTTTSSVPKPLQSILKVVNSVPVISSNDFSLAAMSAAQKSNVTAGVLANANAAMVIPTTPSSTAWKSTNVSTKEMATTSEAEKVPTTATKTVTPVPASLPSPLKVISATQTVSASDRTTNSKLPTVPASSTAAWNTTTATMSSLSTTTVMQNSSAAMVVPTTTTKTVTSVAMPLPSALKVMSATPTISASDGTKNSRLPSAPTSSTAWTTVTKPNLSTTLMPNSNAAMVVPTTTTKTVPSVAMPLPSALKVMSAMVVPTTSTKTVTFASTPLPSAHEGTAKVSVAEVVRTAATTTVSSTAVSITFANNLSQISSSTTKTVPVLMPSTSASSSITPRAIITNTQTTSTLPKAPLSTSTIPSPLAAKSAHVGVEHAQGTSTPTKVVPGSASSPTTMSTESRRSNRTSGSMTSKEAAILLQNGIIPTARTAESLDKVAPNVTKIVQVPQPSASDTASTAAEGVAVKPIALEIAKSTTTRPVPVIATKEAVPIPTSSPMSVKSTVSIKPTAVESKKCEEALTSTSQAAINTTKIAHTPKPSASTTAPTAKEGAAAALAVTKNKMTSAVPGTPSKMVTVSTSSPSQMTSTKTATISYVSQSSPGQQDETNAYFYEKIKKFMGQHWTILKEIQCKYGKSMLQEFRNEVNARMKDLTATEDATSYADFEKELLSTGDESDIMALITKKAKCIAAMEAKIRAEISRRLPYTMIGARGFVNELMAEIRQKEPMEKMYTNIEMMERIQLQKTPLSSESSAAASTKSPAASILTQSPSTIPLSIAASNVSATRTMATSASMTPERKTVDTNQATKSNTDNETRPAIRTISDIRTQAPSVLKALLTKSVADSTAIITTSSNTSMLPSLSKTTTPTTTEKAATMRLESITATATSIALTSSSAESGCAFSTVSNNTPATTSSNMMIQSTANEVSTTSLCSNAIAPTLTTTATKTPITSTKTTDSVKATAKVTTPTKEPIVGSSIPAVMVKNKPVLSTTAEVTEPVVTTIVKSNTTTTSAISTPKETLSSTPSTIATNITPSTTVALIAVEKNANIAITTSTTKDKPTSCDSSMISIIPSSVTTEASITTSKSIDTAKTTSTMKDTSIPCSAYGVAPTTPSTVATSALNISPKNILNSTTEKTPSSTIPKKPLAVSSSDAVATNVTDSLSTNTSTSATTSKDVPISSTVAETKAAVTSISSNVSTVTDLNPVTPDSTIISKPTGEVAKDAAVINTNASSPPPAQVVVPEIPSTTAPSLITSSPTAMPTVTFCSNSSGIPKTTVTASSLTTSVASSNSVTEAPIISAGTPSITVSMASSTTTSTTTKPAPTASIPQPSATGSNNATIQHSNAITVSSTSDVTSTTGSVSTTASYIPPAASDASSTTISTPSSSNQIEPNTSSTCSTSQQDIPCIIFPADPNIPVVTLSDSPVYVDIDDESDRENKSCNNSERERDSYRSRRDGSEDRRRRRDSSEDRRRRRDSSEDRRRRRDSSEDRRRRRNTYDDRRRRRETSEERRRRYRQEKRQHDQRGYKRRKDRSPVSPLPTSSPQTAVPQKNMNPGAAAYAAWLEVQEKYKAVDMEKKRKEDHRRLIENPAYIFQMEYDQQRRMEEEARINARRASTSSHHVTQQITYPLIPSFFSTTNITSTKPRETEEEKAERLARFEKSRVERKERLAKKVITIGDDDNSQIEKNKEEMRRLIERQRKKAEEEFERKKKEEEQRKIDELKRLEEEKQREEERRRKEEEQKKKDEEQRKLDELRRLEEKKRREDERRKMEEEQKKKEEEQRKLNELKRLEEEKQREEERRKMVEEQKKKEEEQRRKEEQKRKEEEHRREMLRRIEEQKKLEELKRAEEEKKKEDELRKNEEEQKRIQEEQRKEEEKKIIEERRREADQRQKEEEQKKKEEEMRREEELKKQKEQLRLKEEKYREEEQKRKEENDRRKKAEEDMRMREEKMKEEERKRQNEKEIRDLERKKLELQKQLEAVGKKTPTKIAKAVIAKRKSTTKASWSSSSSSSSSSPVRSKKHLRAMTARRSIAERESTKENSTILQNEEGELPHGTKDDRRSRSVGSRKEENRRRESGVVDISEDEEQQEDDYSTERLEVAPPLPEEVRAMIKSLVDPTRDIQAEERPPSARIGELRVEVQVEQGAIDVSRSSEDLDGVPIDEESSMLTSSRVVTLKASSPKTSPIRCIVQCTSPSREGEPRKRRVVVDRVNEETGHSTATMQHYPRVTRTILNAQSAVGERRKKKDAAYPSILMENSDEAKKTVAKVINPTRPQETITRTIQNDRVAKKPRLLITTNDTAPKQPSSSVTTQIATKISEALVVDAQEALRNPLSNTIGGPSRTVVRDIREQPQKKKRKIEVTQAHKITPETLFVVTSNSREAKSSSASQSSSKVTTPTATTIVTLNPQCEKRTVHKNVTTHASSLTSTLPTAAAASTVETSPSSESSKPKLSFLKNVRNITRKTASETVAAQAETDDNRRIEQLECEQYLSGNCKDGVACKKRHNVWKKIQLDRKRAEEEKVEQTKQFKVRPLFQTADSKASVATSSSKSKNEQRAVPATSRDESKTCRRLLRGLCRPNERCSEAHNLQPHEYPICQFYLDLKCYDDHCTLLHVKHSDDTPLCVDFNKRKCYKGDDCDFQHVYHRNIINHMGVRPQYCLNRQRPVEEPRPPSTSTFEWLQ